MLHKSLLLSAESGGDSRIKTHAVVQPAASRFMQAFAEPASPAEGDLDKRHEAGTSSRQQASKTFQRSNVGMRTTHSKLSTLHSVVHGPHDASFLSDAHDECCVTSIKGLRAWRFDHLIDWPFADLHASELVDVS